MPAEKVEPVLVIIEMPKVMLLVMFGFAKSILRNEGDCKGDFTYTAIVFVMAAKSKDVLHLINNSFRDSRIISSAQLKAFDPERFRPQPGAFPLADFEHHFLGSMNPRGKGG